MMLMMVFWLIVPLLLIGVITDSLGWRPQFKETGQAQTSEAPLDVLKARYARGEISREEYDQIHHDLGG